jgi:hypothetical protein
MSDPGFGASDFKQGEMCADRAWLFEQADHSECLTPVSVTPVSVLLRE